MNQRFNLKQRVAALCMAAMMCCSLFPAGVFAEVPQPEADGTPIVVQDNENVTPDAPQTDESDPDPGENTPEESETPIVTQGADEDKPVDDSTDYTFDGAVLYTDLPDAPTGSYMGSQGLPVATGETKIGISAWPNDQLEEGTDSYLSSDTLNSDDLTMTAPLLEGTDYAVVPILAQVEYPADGSSLDVVLPNEVTVLDFYGAPADEATRSRLVHSEYTETSAAVMGLYVQADADFSAQLVYTAPDGSTLTKVLHVVIDRSRTMAAPFAETTDVAAYAERPTPAVTSGKITKVEKVNGTWLIWFNGEEAYCCTHGANGQPKGCPPYTYTNTSLVSADQCIPGDHYGNQYRIWGGLDQLSMDLLPDTPVAFSAEDTERISLLDFCRTIYDDSQLWLIENYPESTAAKIYLESAQALLDGAVAYAKPRGYYTYIYTPARSGWQTVALIGPEISEEETEEPKPVVQEYYASWEAPAQSASGTVDLTYGITTDKIQLKTLEKVDGATIEIEPITKSGTIDGGSWSISPAGVQTVTTSGHTNDDNYQNNGGAASASWSVHYTVTKTVGGRSGSVGPYTTKEAADAAANSERDSAVAAIQAEAQSAVNNAIASAQAQLASLQFRYDEVTIPYGFESYWGSNGSHQTITVPANSNNAYKICSTVQQQTCRFDSILYEQRNSMNSMLPLGKKWLGLERTLETVSTAIYVPFTTQELFQPGGLYEGINARSKNLILCNRKLLPAPAGMVLGMTGYGKSFSVMQMVTNIMLRWPDDDIVLIDPEQEYTHLVTAMGGVVIDISASSPSHINPMDITEDYGDDEDPIRLKSQFLQNFCQLILHSSELSPQERTFIDVAAGLTYQRYMANPKREEMPTLHDFYRNLALQGEEVKPLLTALKLYVSGSMDLFAHQTNVNVQNHCICFNTVKLGKSMQSIGMLTVLDQVWNRITRNRVLGRRTWVFTDEFQQLLGNKDCTDFYFQLSSRARKWGAILTSITQHVRSVLDNENARRMLSDCGYIKLLNQSPDDANDLARLLHISNEEKRYIENAEVGSGLLIVSKTVVPFNNDFPKDTELFRLMDTSPNRKS